MVEFTTIVLTVVLLILFYIAYKILKLAFRTFMVSVLCGISYYMVTVTEFATYSRDSLLSVMALGGIGYVAYKILKVPGKLLDRD